MLCRITAVPERELSSGIVAGDTVRILSIVGGEYRIQREMPYTADTIAYCSAGLLVPLDKSLPPPPPGRGSSASLSSVLPSDNSTIIAVSIVCVILAIGLLAGVGVLAWNRRRAGDGRLAVQMREVTAVRLP